MRVIMIGAHPDDCEIRGGATSALWAEGGNAVQHVAVANGDAGHHSEGGGALASRRAEECRSSAKILGVSWRTLDFHDGEILPTLSVREAVIRAIRDWEADIVITHRPYDYHPDHRYTAQIVQDAASLLLVPDICPGTPPLTRKPVFLSFYDPFRKPVPFVADVVVDADPVMERKWRSLDLMESQVYEWLPWLDGCLAEVPSDRAGRFEWLKMHWTQSRFLSWKKHNKAQLAERYGQPHSEKVKYVEAFELSEYGRQPAREELWKILPK